MYLFLIDPYLILKIAKGINTEIGSKSIVMVIGNAPGSSNLEINPIKTESNKKFTTKVIAFFF